jgi:hypothetical protein
LRLCSRSTASKFIAQKLEAVPILAMAIMLLGARFTTSSAGPEILAMPAVLVVSPTVLTTHRPCELTIAAVGIWLAVCHGALGVVWGDARAWVIAPAGCIVLLSLAPRARANH